MSDDFSRYEAMKAAGETPESAYRAARADGLDFAAGIRMLRGVFGLSFPEAKEVTLKAEGIADSLDAHQGRIADVLERELED